MILKEFDERPTTGDRRITAGNEAERQMAHYLDRAFRTRSDLYVLNNIRLLNPALAATDDRQDAGQIDHLVLHRWGAFIIESKSASESVRVRDDGSGGDEWSRTYHGKREGIPSPVRQAARQGELLRTVLNGNREQLLGKVMPVVRVLTQVLYGTDQRGFKNFPIQVIVAYSDSATIDRGSWKEPTQPFRTYVCKADLVTQKIEQEFAKHTSASGLLSASQGNYGVWEMKIEELPRVAEFLRVSHAPLVRSHAREETPALKLIPAPVAAAMTAKTAAHSSVAACRACGADRLIAMWGKYGYYWKCAACDGNTPMPVICSGCGAKGQHGQFVRIRKSGLEYFRDCECCGLEEALWRQS